jgi:endonuclease/exonuclease/phosphatase family metal-dependent hydrolase
MPSRGRAVATLSLGAGAVGVGWALSDALRIWLPTLLLGATGARGPASAMLEAGVVVAVPALAAALVLRVPPRVVWLLGAATLLGARLALATTGGGAALRWTATVAVAGGAAAVVALAAGAPRGDVARAGLLVGTAGSWAVLAGLHGVDLVWRSGATARLATLGLVAAAGLAALRTSRQLEAGRGAAARPWALIGLGLALVGIVGAPAGRIAVATGWEAGRVGAAAVLLQLLAVLAVLAAVRLGPLTAGPVAAVLVLGGTAAALDPTSVRAVAGQAAVLIGLGAAWGAGPRGLATGPGRRALVAAGGWIAFVAVVLAHHAAPTAGVPWDAATVVVATAVLVAIACLAGTARAARHGRERIVVGPLAAAALVVPVALVLALAATVRPDAAPTAPSDGSVRVVQANVNLGFDPDGRRRAPELGATLADLDADVIVLNEVDRGRYAAGAADLLATYATATGLSAVFGPTTDALHGTAVLTRLEVVEVSRQTLPLGADPRTRAALTVVLERPDGTRLAVVATRLSDVDRRGDTRLPQAQAVAGIVARLRERGLDVIVVGDLASAPGDPALAVLEELLVRALPDSVRTYPATAPRVQVDHVLVPPTWTVTSVRALNTGLTDHRVVDVVLRPPPLDVDAADVDGGRDGGRRG